MWLYKLTCLSLWGRRWKKRNSDDKFMTSSDAYFMLMALCALCIQILGVIFLFLLRECHQYCYLTSFFLIRKQWMNIDFACHRWYFLYIFILLYIFSFVCDLLWFQRNLFSILFPRIKIAFILEYCFWNGC